MIQDALIEVLAKRRFALVNILNYWIQYQTTILGFRQLLERYNLVEQIFEADKARIIQRGMAMK